MSPGTILGKYLIRKIVLNFFLVLCAVLGIILMFEVIEMLRRVSDRSDAGIMLALQMAAAKVPSTFELVFPFVLLIAGMVTFWQVSRSNEFVIIRASGVSIWGFLKPVLAATFFIGVLNVTLINPISSYLFEVYETLEYRFSVKNPKAVLFTDKGLFIREAASTSGNFIIFQAKQIRQEGDGLFFREVSIIEMDRKSQMTKRIEAYAANLSGDRFMLKDVKIFEPGKPTVYRNSFDYKTTLTVGRIKESFINPEALSFWQLPDTIEFYEKAGFSAQKHIMRYRTLLASPFLLCAMMLVAAVFALRPNTRRGGVLYMIVGGIVTGFLVYFLSQVIYAFGINNYIPSLLAAWIPTLVVGMVAVSVLLHLEDG